jgi:hypothetical protein
MRVVRDRRHVEYEIEWVYVTQEFLEELYAEIAKLRVAAATLVALLAAAA